MDNELYFSVIPSATDEIAVREGGTRIESFAAVSSGNTLPAQKSVAV